MKVCPKCGEQHQDSDLRTMCGRCLTSLEYRETAAPPTPVEEQKPPAVETASPVEFRTVEMPSVEEAVGATLPAPAPEPAAPLPAAQAAPVRPIPQTRTQPQKQVIAQAAEHANYRATAWAVLAWLTGFMAAWFALRAAAKGTGEGTTMAFLFLALTVWFMWEWSRWSWVRSVEATFPGRVPIGGSVPFAVTLDAAKDLSVNGVLIRLRATETSWVRRGKGGSRHSRQIVTLQKVLAERIGLKPGERLRLDGELQIPHDAPASFTSDPGSIQWAAHLWVALPGFHADIRQRFPVKVAPYRADESAQRQWPERWKPLLDLRDCKAEVALEADLDKSGNFALETGRATQGRLRIVPLSDIDATGAVVELTYAAESSAMARATTTYHEVLACPGLKKGVEVNWGFIVPGLDGPLSFRGSGFFVTWVLAVTVHRKQARPLTARLPITVMPGPAP